MYCFGKYESAKAMAEEKGLLFGMSVFDGRFYVGTKEQLERIGVLIEK